MIERSEIFNEVKDNLALWCGADCAGADLAAAAGVAITNKLRAVSVSPMAIAPIWAWLENTKIRIFGRFNVDKKIDDDFMSDFASRISASFRDGADGAIVFMRLRDLGPFISELAYVRDDLFFNKTMSIGLDINEIDSSDWDRVFDYLQSVRVDALTLFMSRDDGDKSDFVGRVYAMLNAKIGDWHGALHFVLGKSVTRIDQVYRLTQQLRLDKLSSMLFFVNND